MRKIILATALAVCWSMSDAAAQSSNTPIKIETVTSLLPKDGTPLRFSSVEEMNGYVPDRIAELKQIIVDVQHDADKANFYREELWRAENAIVESN